MSWTFLSNHGHVLLFIAEYPEAKLKEIASNVGITERMVSIIISDLEGAGAISVKKIGRRNSYSVIPSFNLRHPLEENKKVSDLIRLLGE
jgi:DNA-binding transcriptional regulator PaaX